MELLEIYYTQITPTGTVHREVSYDDKLFDVVYRFGDIESMIGPYKNPPKGFLQQVSRKEYQDEIYKIKLDMLAIYRDTEFIDKIIADTKKKKDGYLYYGRVPYSKRYKDMAILWNKMSRVNQYRNFIIKVVTRDRQVVVILESEYSSSY